MKKEVILKAISVSVLLTLFGLHVKDSLSKFVSGQMTMALSAEKYPEGVTPPSISFCPGRKMKEDNLEEMLNRTNGEPTKQDYVEWHHAHTYSLNEILLDVIAPHHGSINRVNGSGLVPDTHEEMGMVIREVAIFHGRCYTIDFDWKLKPREYFTFYFNLTVLDDKQMVIFFHERYNEVGLSYGYWPIKPLSVRLRPEDEVSLFIRKGFRISHSRGEKCEKDEDYSYPKCVLDWARDNYKNSNKTDCWYPNVDYLTQGLELQPCKTLDEVEDSFAVAMWDTVKWMTEREVTGCLLRCKRVTFQLENVMQPVTYAKVNGTAEVYMYMSDRVETAEEYRLFGPNAIISSVGGALGLFLGFSCLSALNIVRKRVATNYLG